MDTRFLLDLAILLFVAKMFGVQARKFGAPEVVGEIIAGLAVGPAALGLVHESDFLSQMAEIGVIMLMFEAGLGTNLKKLRRTGARATLIACAGVFVPMIFGALLFIAFYGASGSNGILKGLFIGTIMAATSVSITVAALKELGKLNGVVDDRSDIFTEYDRRTAGKYRTCNRQGRVIFYLGARHRLFSF